MTLNQLTDENYSRQKRKRVGRGIGSGTGKTCGAGHKGQKSRSGVSVNGFEGGQMPIYRRVPKRGFVNVLRVSIHTINVGEIQRYVDNKRIDASKPIDCATLVEAGILKRVKPLKLLAKGEIKSPLKFVVDAASASAIEAVKKAGGSVTLVEPARKKAA
jgi:large subunit ribosomal protein L15